MTTDFIVMRKKYMVCMVSAFLMLPGLAHAQKDSISTLKKSAYLKNHSANATSFDFGVDKWQYLIVNMNGTYQKDITKAPSQNFTITVNGSNVFSGDVYGDKMITIDLDYGTQKTLIVAAKLVSVHGASTYAAGNVEVIAFREKPGIFYVTEIIYDLKNAMKISEERITANEVEIHNSSSGKMDVTETLSYTVSKSIHWDKTTSFLTSVGLSVGYKSGSTGGFEAMGSLSQSFTKSYNEGTTNTETTTVTNKATVQMEPNSHRKLFIIQNRVSTKIPYQLKGYYLDANGERTYDSSNGNCIFTNVISSNIQTADLASNAEPEVLKVIPNPDFRKYGK